MRFWVVLLMSVVAGSAALSAPMTARSHIYSVIFEISADENGKLAAATVSEVIDPYTGSTKAVDVPVPDEYVAAVRASLQDKQYKPRDHYFTYFYFDPARPTDMNVMPR